MLRLRLLQFIELRRVLGTRAHVTCASLLPAVETSMVSRLNTCVALPEGLTPTEVSTMLSTQDVDLATNMFTHLLHEAKLDVRELTLRYNSVDVTLGCVSPKNRDLHGHTDEDLEPGLDNYALAFDFSVTGNALNLRKVGVGGLDL